MAAYRELWQSWWRSIEKLRRSSCVSLAMIGCQEKNWCLRKSRVSIWGWCRTCVRTLRQWWSVCSSHRWEWAYWDQGSALSSLLFALVDWQVGRWGCEGVCELWLQTTLWSLVRAGKKKRSWRGGDLLFWFPSVLFSWYHQVWLLSLCLCFLSLLFCLCACAWTRLRFPPLVWHTWGNRLFVVDYLITAYTYDHSWQSFFMDHRSTQLV